MENCAHCGGRLSAQIDWCGQCYARLGAPAPAAPDTGHLTVIAVPCARRPSFLEGGPVALGLVGKLVLTGLVMAVGVAEFVWLGPWWELGKPAWALGSFMMTLYAIIATMVLVHVWHTDVPVSRAERIIVLDRGLVEHVERNQRALAHRVV